MRENEPLSYMRMLAGVPGVKPDPVFRRFIATPWNCSAMASRPFALRPMAAAMGMDISSTDLDRAVRLLRRSRTCASTSSLRAVKC